jgi:hypothetical protein
MLATSSPQSPYLPHDPCSNDTCYSIPMVAIPSTCVYLRNLLFSTLGTALCHVAYPLHCYRCQKLGHTQTPCTSDIVCHSMDNMPRAAKLCQLVWSPHIWLTRWFDLSTRQHSIKHVLYRMPVYLRGKKNHPLQKPKSKHITFHSGSCFLL